MRPFGCGHEYLRGTFRPPLLASMCEISRFSGLSSECFAGSILVSRVASDRNVAGTGWAQKFLRPPMETHFPHNFFNTLSFESGIVSNSLLDLWICSVLLQGSPVSSQVCG